MSLARRANSCSSGLIRSTVASTALFNSYNKDKQDAAGKEPLFNAAPAEIKGERKQNNAEKKLLAEGRLVDKGLPQPGP